MIMILKLIHEIIFLNDIIILSQRVVCGTYVQLQLHFFIIWRNLYVQNWRYRFIWT